VADEEQLKIIRQGVVAWNGWREKNPELRPNLSRADLSGLDLSGANLSRARLRQANLSWVCLCSADLSRADLCKANLSEANLSQTNLNGANLSQANLSRANLRGAELNGVDLVAAQLIQTNLFNATLTGSRVYGVSVWDIKVNDQTNQQNLLITPDGEAAITVDNIKVAQFIYLLLNNREIRDVIDTITSKAVLILGRFSPERKIILDRLREELRTRRYVPIMFDFEKPKSRDTIETIRTLAGMAKFIIADLTEAKAVVQELQAIVPNLPSVVVRFIIMKAEREPGMFDHIRQFPWVIDGAFEYENADEVINSIPSGIIDPVEKRLRELAHQ
jgi:Pentapeptide repeats (8 copies)